LLPSTLCHSEQSEEPVLPPPQQPYAFPHRATRYSVLGTRYQQLFLEYHIPVKHPTQRSIPSKLAHSLALVTLLTVLTPWAAAQRTAHASARPALPHLNHPTGNFAFGQNARPYGSHRSSRTSLPFPFLGDFFNPDDLYSTGYPVASQPPMILLQATRALAGSSDYSPRTNNDRERSTPTQPLMIELQNGRYVRITSTAANGEPLPIEPTHAQLDSTKLTTEPRPHNLAPAVLVFRDGHTEEVRDYAIADGTLYARGDYYTDGYWNKKIELSTLNVAETLQANATRNVKFILPTSPNEVVTRP
jgi:hypothetical protein